MTGRRSIWTMASGTGNYLATPCCPGLRCPILNSRA